MKITKDYTKKIIEEIIPLVLEENQLENKLGEYKIKISSNKEILDKLTNYPIGKFRKIISCYAVQGGYEEETNTFYVLKKFNGNTDNFKEVNGHEIHHGLQFTNFPRLLELYKNLGGIKRDSLNTLLEGDARLIQKNLKEKYFKNSKYHLGILELMSSYTLPTRAVNYYLVGENILRRRFNANRKDINELYNAPIEELVKIFGRYI